MGLIDWVCLSVKIAHLTKCTSREAGSLWSSSETQKDYWTPALLFIHKHTKLSDELLSSRHPSCCVYQGLCYNVFILSHDDKGMVCDLCKGIYLFFLISPMSSSYINFNKFLRIWWCTFIWVWVGESEHVCMPISIVGFKFQAGLLSNCDLSV